MSYEKIIQPIESRSLEEHENLLEERMIGAQLEYTDRLFSKKIPPFEVFENSILIDDFRYLLNRYSGIIFSIIQYRRKVSEQNGTKWSEEMSNSSQTELEDKIINFRKIDIDHWIEKTINLLIGERAKEESVVLAQAEENIKTEKTNETSGGAGVLSFEVPSGFGKWFKDTNIPIKNEDFCLDIHLGSLYQKTLTNEAKNIFSSKSLEKIAIEIVTKFPQAKAIIGKSWLMSTPLARRAGFTVYEPKETIYEKGPFWGQFLNSVGQIDGDRLSSFIETGKPPYPIAFGAMMTEDFLRKYLPQERKGEILLQEINYKFAEEYRKEIEIFKEIGENWDMLDEVGLKNIFIHCPVLQDFIKTQEGDGFTEMLLDLKKKNYPREFINTRMTDKFSKPLSAYY